MKNPIQVVAEQLNRQKKEREEIAKLSTAEASALLSALVAESLLYEDAHKKYQELSFKIMKLSDKVKKETKEQRKEALEDKTNWEVESFPDDIGSWDYMGTATFTDETEAKEVCRLHCTSEVGFAIAWFGPGNYTLSVKSHNDHDDDIVYDATWVLAK